MKGTQLLHDEDQSLWLNSRGEADFANKLLSAMRYQFGGHLEKSDGRTGR
jgi:6-phosphogluconate dehydrogenase (decarboxylating)